MTVGELTAYRNKVTAAGGNFDDDLYTILCDNSVYIHPPDHDIIWDDANTTLIVKPKNKMTHFGKITPENPLKWESMFIPYDCVQQLRFAFTSKDVRDNIV